MAQSIRKIAKQLGAEVVAQVPDVGGGAFGAARLAAILSQRLSPGHGKRPGRPTDPTWTRHPKVPMSKDTLAQLEALAQQLSASRRKISPMQVAAQLLEETVGRYAEKAV